MALSWGMQGSLETCTSPVGAGLPMMVVGCLRKWLLEFRKSRNFIQKWSYFREISSNFVYFRITFYTTFHIIWHDFHTKFRIPSNKNLTNSKYLWNLGLYWVLKLYKNKRNEIQIRIRKVYFRMVYETKKIFEIYEISSIRNVVKNLFSTDDISTHSRETSRRWLGVGEVRQYTPQPLPLHCCHSLKKIGITSDRISQNITEFCIDLHRKISYNFAKFGPFSNGIRNKKKH